jgi:hypothetical protein
MSRTSNDVYVDGVLIDGFDYLHQAWVSAGFYLDCAHPKSMSCGCYGRKHADEPCTHRFMDDIENYHVPSRVNTHSELQAQNRMELVEVQS